MFARRACEPELRYASWNVDTNYGELPWRELPFGFAWFSSGVVGEVGPLSLRFR